MKNVFIVVTFFLFALSRPLNAQTCGNPCPEPTTDNAPCDYNNIQVVDDCGGSWTCSCDTGYQCNRAPQTRLEGCDYLDSTGTGFTCGRCQFCNTQMCPANGCGTLTDACGHTQYCNGNPNNPNDCGPNGTCNTSTNQCMSCTPTTCSAEHATCGVIRNGNCPQNLVCGTCPAGAYCTGIREPGGLTMSNRCTFNKTENVAAVPAVSRKHFVVLAMALFVFGMVFLKRKGKNR